MQVSGLVAVDVVDASSGRPIERYEVQLRSAALREPRAAPVFLRGRHAGGHLEARVDVSSPAMLRVVPADEGFAPSAPALVAPDPIRPGAVRVELRRWTEEPRSRMSKARRSSARRGHRRRRPAR